MKKAIIVVAILLISVFAFIMLIGKNDNKNKDKNLIKPIEAPSEFILSEELDKEIKNLDYAIYGLANQSYKVTNYEDAKVIVGIFEGRESVEKEAYKTDNSVYFQIYKNNKLSFSIYDFDNETIVFQNHLKNEKKVYKVNEDVIIKWRNTYLAKNN